MTAAELIRLLTSAAFLVLTVALARQLLRERTGASLDALVFFGACLFLAGQSWALAHPAPAAIEAAAIICLVLLPYLLIRVVADFTAVPRWVLLGSLGVSVLLALASVDPSLSGSARYGSGPFLVALALYVFTAGVYSAFAFASQAARSMGIVRRRLTAAALAASTIGVLLVVSVLAFLPDWIWTPATLLLGLLGAVSYLAAFAPPPWLRRAWREPDLREFMARVAAIPLSSSLPDLLLQLESAIRSATGTPVVSILVFDEAADQLRDRADLRLGSGEGLPGRALSEQRGVIGEDIVVPITRLEGRLGVLVLGGRRAQLFASEELEMAQLLAVQAGIVLAGSRPYTDLITLNEQLQKATTAKSAFLSNMSHELRTPLNAILGFAGLLTEQLAGVATERQARFLRNITQAGDHLLILVNDVLDLAKVEAGKIELRRELMPIAEVLEPVAAALSGAAGAKGLAVQLALPAELDLFVDPTRLRQVLLNLVSNAVKYTASGSVRLAAESVGADLHLTVTDSGVGIPLALQYRMFGEFDRLHEGTGTKKGTGLGLAVSKRLVELMGGTIEFSSEDGVGTTFRIFLPHVVMVPLSGPRVLVVEDERHAAELIQAMAATLDLATEIVPTLASAHAAIARSAPIGVVLDMQLPDGRGEVLLRELGGPSGHIPVVVVTGESDPESAFLLGAEEYITKPIDWARLLTWLRHIKASRPAETAEAELV